MTRSGAFAHPSDPTPQASLEFGFPIFSPESISGCSTDSTHSRYFSSCLFTEPKLGVLLKFWFDELEYYYPIVDRYKFYSDLNLLFSNHLSYEDGVPQVPAQREYIILAALACEMLAVATFLGAGAERNQRLQGGGYFVHASLLWHHESRRLLRSYSLDGPRDLYVVCLHVLEVIYMTMLQRRGDMSRAMVLAIDEAFATELNNEQLWTACTQREQEYRRLLWWTVYFLDRCVAFFVKRPYIIHDADYVVSCFMEQSLDTYLSDPLLLTPVNLPHLWQLPSNLTEDWFVYLQFNVRWSKIATRVWDSFFSLRGCKHTKSDEFELIEALLTKLSCDLPSSLRWNTQKTPTLISPGSQDMSLRLQMIIFEVCTYDIISRINHSGRTNRVKRVGMLRLHLHFQIAQTNKRQFARNDQWHTAGAAQDIAAATINSVSAYLAARNDIRPWSTYGSIILVEVSKSIALVVKAQTVPKNATSMVMSSIIRAHKCLQRMVKMKIEAAEIGTQQLGSLLDDLADHCSNPFAQSLSFEGISEDNGFLHDQHKHHDDSGVDHYNTHWGLEEFWLGDDWGEAGSP